MSLPFVKEALQRYFDFYTYSVYHFQYIMLLIKRFHIGPVICLGPKQPTLDL